MGTACLAIEGTIWIMGSVSLSLRRFRTRAAAHGIGTTRSASCVQKGTSGIRKDYVKLRTNYANKPTDLAIAWLATVATN